MQIPVDDVIVSDRVRKDVGSLDSLKESLSRVGLLNPIVVTPKLELVAGFRRLSAVRELGWRTVEATVVEGLDAKRRLEMELEENLYRKDFTPEEVLEGWKKLDRANHPGALRRVGRAIRFVLGKLAFWRWRRRKPAAAPAPAAPEPAPEAAPAADNPHAI